MNKYSYYKVIQSGTNGNWDDESMYECNSKGVMDSEERGYFIKDLREYRMANYTHGRAVRVIFRRELNILETE